MKAFFAAMFAAVMVAGLFPTEAEARRFGGARSLGAKRQAVTPQQRPAAAQPQAQTSQQGVPRTGPGRWLAPLAGLAAGLGLAYLFGDEMGALLTALLIGVAVVVLLGFVMRAMRPRMEPPAQSMQYAGLGRETVAAPPPSQMPNLRPVPGVGSSAVARIPASFDTDGFLRQARKNFVAMQAANDRGDVDSIRDLVTEEMFEALERDVSAHGAAGSHTEIVTLNADLLEVVTENGMHWASIRFSGVLGEEEGGPPTPFEEIWNLQKPEKGQSGWLLAGIQQVP
jgi:predicted lipid-binding transport protein (Tim44 family)